MAQVALIIFEVVKAIVVTIWDFVCWVYLTLLPFIVVYIGIPLFVLGLLMGTAFSAGSFIIIVVFFVAMYFFIKKTIFHNPFAKLPSTNTS